MADSRPQDIKQQNGQAAAKSTVQVGADAARQGAEAMQQGSRVTSEALRRGGEFAAEATRRGGEAGCEAVPRTSDAAGETIRHSSQDVADSQRQFVQDATERFEDVSRKVAQAVQGTTENVRTLMELPNAAQGRAARLAAEHDRSRRGSRPTNLRAAQELFRLANPSALVELQQRFAGEYLDTLMQGSATLIRAVRRTADQTLGQIEEQIEQRQQARRGGRHHGGERGSQNAAE